MTILPGSIKSAQEQAYYPGEQPARPTDLSRHQMPRITYRSSLEHEAKEMKIGNEGKCLSKLIG